MTSIIWERPFVFIYHYSVLQALRTYLCSYRHTLGPFMKAPNGRYRTATGYGNSSRRIRSQTMAQSDAASSGPTVLRLAIGHFGHRGPGECAFYRLARQGRDLKGE